MAEDLKKAEIGEKLSEIGGKMEKVPLASLLPKIDFVDDVDAFMKLPENGQNAQNVLKAMEEIYSRAKLLESTHASNKQRLKSQIGELGRTLEMITELKLRKEKNEEMITHFKLAEHVHTMAKVKPVEKIGLWLGANIMLEYDVDEGKDLLQSKKEKAEETLKTTNETIDKMREAITTIEVNMARVYNWDVMRRKAEREALAASKKASTSTSS